MIDINSLTYLQMLMALATGIIIGCIYLFLLWQTLLKLPSVKHKGNFLFISAVVRLALLIFTAVYFSFENGARFLLIFIGFILCRIITMRYVKASIRKEYDQRQKEKTNA